MDSVAVHCHYSELLPPDKLQPHPKNSNRHPEEQVALLAKIIKTGGWRHPVIVSKLSGFIVAGHARRLAAILLGGIDCPVEFQDFATEADDLAFLTADNRLAELAEQDFSMLLDNLESLDTGGFDMDMTGFDEINLERVMTQLKPEGPQEIDEEELSDTKHQCPKCSFKW